MRDETNELTEAQAVLDEAKQVTQQARAREETAEAEVQRLNSADPDLDPLKKQRDIRAYLDHQDGVRRARRVGASYETKVGDA